MNESSEALMWVVRGNYVFYSDEFYYLENFFLPTTTKGVYSTKEKALEACKIQSVRAARTLERWGEGFFEAYWMDSVGDNNISESVFVFYQEASGSSLLEGKWWKANALASLNDDQVYQFLSLAKIEFYQVLPVVTEQVYCLWSLENQAIIYEEDQFGNQFISYSESIDGLWEEINFWVSFFRKGNIVREGDIFEITNHGNLFKAVLRDLKDASYDPVERKLTIKSLDALKALNDLLKEPVYEIRKMDFEKIVQLEETLNARRLTMLNV